MSEVACDDRGGYVLIPRGMHIGHFEHHGMYIFILVYNTYRLLMKVYLRTCHDASDPVIMC